MPSKKGVTVVSAAIDDSRKDAFVLRGAIPGSKLAELLVAPYQREIGSMAKLQEIMEALKKGDHLQDIVLGMRGNQMEDTGNDITLLDPIYIIDGLQRVTAARQLIQMEPEMADKLQIGAAIYFNTNEVSERHMFKILNTKRTRLSPNVILRNMETESLGIQLFRALSEHKDFVLKGRVGWEQTMKRDQVITACTLLKVSSILHAFLVPGIATRVEEMVNTADKTVETITKTALRDNIKTFFDAVDQCWGIRTVTYGSMAPHLREGFLKTFARYLSRHEVFWKNNRLVIESSLLAKIKGFNIYDPTISNLCGSSGKAQNTLYSLLREHVNSGKRSKRLEERVMPGDDEEDEVEETTTPTDESVAAEGDTENDSDNK